MKNKQNELAAIKNERQTVEGNIKNLMSETTTQKKLQESYDEFMGQTPVIEQMSQYIKNVSALAKSRGMSVGTLNGYYDTLDVVQGVGLVNPVFEIGLKGGFLEMGRFLEELSRKTAFKGIQAARIDYGEREYPLLTG
jgi:Tfp pilus assembly protein PilO